MRDEADLLVLAGDLTNYRQDPRNGVAAERLVRLRIPIVAVLGNHDYESSQACRAYEDDDRGRH